MPALPRRHELPDVGFRARSTGSDNRELGSHEVNAFLDEERTGEPFVRRPLGEFMCGDLVRELADRPLERQC
jgi:hypothetical protein